MKALVDNDILLKGTCYGLLPDLIGTISGQGRVGFLGAARFVLVKHLEKKRLRGDPSLARARLLGFLAENDVVEPTTQEQALAAEFESAAQRLAVSLDSGESQLVAILLARAIAWLSTGDKRAIVAIERMLDTEAALAAARNRILCLEQLIQTLLPIRGIGFVRAAICGEPDIDRSLSICFSCRSQDVVQASVIEGLNSYVADLRRSAPRVLAT